MLLIYDTTPNGHFKHEINISNDLFIKIIELLENSIKCENGFNKFVLKEYSLNIGYNHYLSIKYLIK